MSAHNSVSYRVTAATATIPSVTYPIPEGCKNFIVTNVVADGVCVATLAFGGTTQMIVRSAAAGYTSPVFIPTGLRFAPSAGTTLTLAGAGVGYALLIGYWE